MTDRLYVTRIHGANIVCLEYLETRFHLILKEIYEAERNTVKGIVSKNSIPSILKFTSFQKLLK